MSFEYPDTIYLHHDEGFETTWHEGECDSGTDVRYVKATPLTDAAPDLLEALHEVMSWIYDWDPDFTFENEWDCTEIKARAAIKKATGEE